MKGKGAGRSEVTVKRGLVGLFMHVSVCMSDVQVRREACALRGMGAFERPGRVDVSGVGFVGRLTALQDEEQAIDMFKAGGFF